MMVLIVGSGRKAKSSLIKAYAARADVVIAADGGAQWLDAAGIVPDVLMGDFDSIPPKLLNKMDAVKSIRRIQYQVAKDDTDMALCLDEALRLGAEEIVLMGATGTRLDHSLANLLLLRKAAEKGVVAWIVDEKNKVGLFGSLHAETSSSGDSENSICGSECHCVPMGVGNEIPMGAGNEIPMGVGSSELMQSVSFSSFECNNGIGKQQHKAGIASVKSAVFVVVLKKIKGYKVSLIAISPVVKNITTLGLQYDMAGRDLFLGSTLGVSNEFLDESATIQFASGLLMVMMSRD